jgi:hypothetical protein
VQRANSSSTDGLPGTDTQSLVLNAISSDDSLLENEHHRSAWLARKAAASVQENDDGDENSLHQSEWETSDDELPILSPVPEVPETITSALDREVSNERDTGHQMLDSGGDDSASGEHATLLREARRGKAPVGLVNDQVNINVDNGSTAPGGGVDGERSSPPQSFDLNEGKRFDYPAYIEDGLTILCARAWEQAEASYHSVTKVMTETNWRAKGIMILCGIPEEVLQELISGNLAHTCLQGQVAAINELYDPLSDWSERKKLDAPCVYARILCNTKTGESPTLNQLRRIVLRLRRYMLLQVNSEGTVQEVLEVDNLSIGNTKECEAIKGHRWYLNGEGTHTNVRIRKLSLFCDGIDARLAFVLREDYDKPLRHALHYIGYALRFVSRQEQHHVDNDSSSWLMNLVRATCEAELGDGNTTWGFHDFVVCYLGEDGEVSVAELLLTFVSDALSETGGGFAVHPGGQNVSSSNLNEWTVEEARKLWVSCADFRRQRTPFKRNVKVELQKVKEWPEKCSKRMESVVGSLPEKIARTKELHRQTTRRKNEIRIKTAHIGAKGRTI